MKDLDKLIEALTDMAEQEGETAGDLDDFTSGDPTTDEGWLEKVLEAQALVALERHSLQFQILKLQTKLSLLMVSGLELRERSEKLQAKIASAESQPAA